MRALVYRRYGPPDVVVLEEVPKPVPARNEVLIRTHATTITSADWRARSLKTPPGFGPVGRLVFGIVKPRYPILGTELAGVIAATGAGVTRFEPGDRVIAFSALTYGCHAEFKTMPEDGLIAPKPANLSYEQAAALSFGGTTALDFLRDKGGLAPGEKVLIVGASGGVGSAAVQLARHFGADVTGVCSSANVDLVKSIGAHRVIDYTQTDFARGTASYDIILDTTGTTSYARCERVLNDGGRLLLVLATLAQSLGFGRAPSGSGKKVITGTAAERLEDLQILVDLAEAGHFTPVIDKVYTPEQAVAAHAHVDSGRKRGNVIIRFAAA